MEKPQTLETTDEEGNIYRRVLYRGHTFDVGYPKDPEIRLDEVRDFKCKPDDIVIGSYPKSGFHWLNNIVQMMTTGDLTYKGSPMMLEHEDWELFEKMAAPRVMSFSLPFDLLPTDVKQGGCKIIHLTRNPKDVIVSFHEFLKGLKGFYTGNFNGIVKLFLKKDFYFGAWFNYEKTWCEAKKVPNNKILQMKYEDLKTNLHDGLVTINKFLELGRSDEFLQKVQEAVSFKNLKKEHVDKGLSVGSDYSELVIDSSGLLPIYRKGMIGDWKNYFTVAQSEAFDKLYEKEMGEYDLQLQFE